MLRLASMTQTGPLTQYTPLVPNQNHCRMRSASNTVTSTHPTCTPLRFGFTLSWSGCQVNKLEITADKQFLAAAGNPSIKIFEVSPHLNPDSAQEAWPACILCTAE